MKMCVAVFISIFSTTMALGPIAYAACMAPCLAMCEAPAAAAGPAAPAVAAAIAAECIAACAVACAPFAACFPDSAMILAAGETSDEVVPMPVRALQPGQLVWTLCGGQRMTTKLIHNLRMGGPFAFVDFVAKDADNQTLMAAFTEEHHMPRARSGSNDEIRSSGSRVDEGGFEIVLAKELQQGDTLLALGPQGPQTSRVVSVGVSQQFWKNVLITEAGTVLLANGLLTTTVCEGEEALSPSANFSAAMENWRALHRDWGFAAVHV